MSNAFSFTKGSREGSLSRITDSPGPGGYDVTSGMKVVKDQSPEWTFSRNEKEGKLGDKNIGPGSYDPDLSKLKANIPQYSMANKSSGGSRQGQQKDKLPGPGQYDPPVNTKSPAYTMGGKKQELKTEQIPGPGSYEYQAALLKTQKFGASPQFASKSKRQDIALSQQVSMGNLGPGAYTPNSQVTKSKVQVFGFSKEERLTSARDTSPGPGAYDSGTKEIGKNTHAVSISPYRPQSAKVNDMPGPGSYDAKNKTFAGQDSQRAVTSMRNTTERLSSPSRDQISRPGPGTYDANKDIIKSKTQNVKFGSDKRSNLVSKEELQKPGPGAYDARTLKSARGIKIGERIQTTIKNANPGPGMYDPNHHYAKQSSRAIKISQQMNRTTSQMMFHSQSTNLLGPGQYNVGGDFGKHNQKIFIQGRPKEQRPKEVPGPGQYDPDDNLSKERIKSTIISNSNYQRGINTSRAKDSHQPAPGDYYKQEDFAKNAPKYTFNGRNEEKNRNLSPGPGTYDANDTQIKSTAPGYKQASSKRNEIVSKEEKAKPGPGSYQYSHKTIGKDVPSYTMNSKSQMLKVNQHPGPGAYDPNSNIIKDAIQNVKMLSSKRSEIVSKTVTELPGPGAYDQSQNKTLGKDTTSYTIGNRRVDQKRDDIPGPGSYETNEAINRSKSPSYRVGSSKRQDIINRSVVEQQPGPGAYDQSSQKNGPQYSFVSRKETNYNDNKPGPGAYEPASDLIKEKVISHKISQSQRHEILSKEVTEKPGPGQYDSLNKFGENCPQYTMGGRSKSRLENSPGPGQYEPSTEVVKDKTITYKISQSQRGTIVSKQSSEMPGPGQYQKTSEFGKDALKVSIRGRPQDIEKSVVPGPGTYELTDQIVKDKVVTHKMTTSNRGQIVSKEASQLPGPGNYESPTRIWKDSQTYTIRGRPEEKTKIQSPGPGKYEATDVLVKGKVITYSMPNSKRNDIVSKEVKNLPGPGVYNQQTSIGKTQAYSMGGKPKDQQDSKIPGPGAYDPNHQVIKDSIKNTAASNSQRVEIVSKEVKNLPGPGTYQDHKEFGKDAKQVSIRGRPKEKIGNDNPGPGNYEYSESLSKERTVTYKIGTSERQAIVSRESMSSPGPGAYDSAKREGGPNYSIKGRNDSPSKNLGPGPGHYDPSDSFTKYQSPSIKITENVNQFSNHRSSGIISGEKSLLPGPGMYDQPSNLGKGQAASIRGRPSPERAKEVPGPGAYDGKVEAVRERIQSAKIGSLTQRKLFTDQDLDSPGPGQYDQKIHSNQVTFTIGSKKETKFAKDVPGPGEYEYSDSILKNKTPAVNFGKSPPRNTSGSPRKELEPGPGQYDGRDTTTAQFTSIAYTIPKGENKHKYSETPGPGTYKLPSKFADVPSYSMPNKNEEYRYV